MVEIHDSYRRYFAELKKIYGRADSGTTEHSGRPDLYRLLEAVKNAVQKEITVIHEPSGKDGSAPDFKVEKATAIIGYLENKKPGADLRKDLKSDQMRRYKKLSNNLILTNYHDWLWLEDGEIKNEVSLFSQGDLERRDSLLKSSKIDELNQILTHFFKAEPKPIADAKEFAEALAVRTQILNQGIAELLNGGVGGRLYGLYEVFKEQLHPKLEIDQFADSFAQMLTYGLFLARLNQNEAEDITLLTADKFIPAPFGLMRELVGFLRELENPKYKNLEWLVKEILFIINTMDREKIALELSFKYRASRSLFVGRDAEEVSLFETDPFIYFYEDFLAAYDEKLRKKRGVYYTPPPIVNFIIRSIDNILHDIFEMDEGFANSQKVTALDFACGTGTFMLEIFKQILDKIGESKTETIIKEHLLENIYGFEYLIAAYTIAHLKLWQFLKDKDYTLQDEERLQIFLTNSLQEANETQPNLLVPELSKEAQLASDVKEKKILAITGNPPYSVSSQNPSRINGQLTWIGKFMEDYKKIKGVPIKEKNLKPLQDDYAKFIRFAQYKIDEAGEGVVGIISNRGFIWGGVFPGMRYSLMNSFDQIYILDLHGDSRIKETAPDGGKDENIFDIQTGVCISFFIKKKGIKKGVFHYDLWGRTNYKYHWAKDNRWDSIKWEKLQPQAPDYLFIPQDERLKPEYNNSYSLTDIFVEQSIGIISKRDSIAIQFTKKEMQETIEKFVNLPPEKARQGFRLRADNSGWQVKRSQDDIKKHGQGENLFKPIAYRAFDTRYTYYSGKVNGFLARPCVDVMKHIVSSNVALISSRQNLLPKFSNVFITKHVVDLHLTDYGSKVYPLYTYPEERKGEKFKFAKKEENFNPKFRQYINEKYQYKFTPEEILGYIYAILHIPAYRVCYHEFLKRDFPKISFCEDKASFEKIATIGQEIMDLHLLKTAKKNSKIWCGERGKIIIDKIQYNEKEEKIHLNERHYIHPIEKEVWDFKIGRSHEVIKSYLSARKNRELTLTEMSDLEMAIDAIRKTIDAMSRLDELSKEVFPHWHEASI